MKNKNKENKGCSACYQIKCKNCTWVASEDEILKIQQGILIACPNCGWKPKGEK